MLDDYRRKTKSALSRERMKEWVKEREREKNNEKEIGRGDE